MRKCTGEGVSAERCHNSTHHHHLTASRSAAHPTPPDAHGGEAAPVSVLPLPSSTARQPPLTRPQNAQAGEHVWRHLHSSARSGGGGRLSGPH